MTFYTREYAILSADEEHMSTITWISITCHSSIYALGISLINTCVGELYRFSITCKQIWISFRLLLHNGYYRNTYACGYGFISLVLIMEVLSRTFCSIAEISTKMFKHTFVSNRFTYDYIYRHCPVLWYCHDNRRYKVLPAVKFTMRHSVAYFKQSNEARFLKIIATRKNYRKMTSTASVS